MGPFRAKCRRARPKGTRFAQTRILVRIDTIWAHPAIWGTMCTDILFALCCMFMHFNFYVFLFCDGSVQQFCHTESFHWDEDGGMKTWKATSMCVCAWTDAISSIYVCMFAWGCMYSNCIGLGTGVDLKIEKYCTDVCMYELANVWHVSVSVGGVCLQLQYGTWLESQLCHGCARGSNTRRRVPETRATALTHKASGTCTAFH